MLPFKLERTEEKVTARSGLALYAEFMKGMRLEELVDRHMPRAGSGRGFKAISYIEPHSMMLYGGGEAIEEVREIREDHRVKRHGVDKYKKLWDDKADRIFIKKAHNFLVQKTSFQGGVLGEKQLSRCMQTFNLMLFYWNGDIEYRVVHPLCTGHKGKAEWSWIQGYIHLDYRDGVIQQKSDYQEPVKNTGKK
ncbi:MAG: hypothetical protein A2Y97_04100 [Nitrospirae bacterium RBG_13_39_12]|nr:MAG: hypothetical protein A2Y97_04100 [Nitrospirae bacterium RBG_13_39_12]